MAAKCHTQSSLKSPSIFQLIHMPLWWHSQMPQLGAMAACARALCSTNVKQYVNLRSQILSLRSPIHFFFLTLAAQLTLASSTDSSSLLGFFDFFFFLKRLLIRQTFYRYGSRLILLLSPSFLPPCSPAARRFKVLLFFSDR